MKQVAGGRVAWIDAAKGITILLMLIGHTVGNNWWGCLTRGLIFSFHMPLFFTLSLVTYRFSTSREDFVRKTRKSAIHLLVPVAVVRFIVLVIAVYQDASILTDPAYWMNRILMFFYASGVNLTNNIGVDVSPLGMMWFPIVLFAGRTIFDFLHLQSENNGLLLIWVCMSSLVGICLANTLWLPLSLDICLVIMPFFYLGAYIQTNDRGGGWPWQKILAAGIFWLATLFLEYPHLDSWTYLELASRHYPLFPLCILTAMAGMMVIFELSVLFARLPIIAKPILYIGRYSLYILCIHALDEFWNPLWRIDGHQFRTAICRIVVDLCVFAIVMLLRAGWNKARHEFTKR